MYQQNYKKFLLAIFFAALFWSGIKPHDYFTWILEVFPALIGLALLVALRKKIEFTPLLYYLMLLHAIVLMIGGHWTYAEVPLFNYLRDIGIFARNNYDKIGHLMQGLVPVLIVREILARRSPLGLGKWLGFLAVSVVMSFSAYYEFIEWWISVLTGSKGDSFLGTQGYIWDTQSDMLFCLIGAVIAVVLLGKYHNTQIRMLAKESHILSSV
jgi:putative membrane protein